MRNRIESLQDVRMMRCDLERPCKGSVHYGRYVFLVGGLVLLLMLDGVSNGHGLSETVGDGLITAYGGFFAGTLGYEREQMFGTKSEAFHFYNLCLLSWFLQPEFKQVEQHKE